MSTTPSYARATASSNSRASASPHTPKTPHASASLQAYRSSSTRPPRTTRPASTAPRGKRASGSPSLASPKSQPQTPVSISSPLSTPRQTLKRPSTLTNHDREFQAVLARARKFTIKPREPSKPTFLADLPSEVRLHIYSYALDYSTPIPITLPKRSSINSRRLWPPLLRVCSAIRLECGYELYTKTPFIAYVRDLDFSSVQRWIDKLPTSHRLFLSRNTGLSIELQGNANRYQRFRPNREQELWQECQAYGNLYDLHGKHKMHFLRFSRLADWFLFCGKPVHSRIRWHYEVERNTWVNRRFFGYLVQRPSGDALKSALAEWVGVLALPCVQKARVNEMQKAVMKNEALNLVDELDSAFLKTIPKTAHRVDGLVYPEDDWIVDIARLRRFLEKW